MTASSSPFGALQGLRLLEMGQLLAGPFCGQLMADHGCEVIKIEQPGTGDPMRQWGRADKLWWPVVARNKKSVTLNLREAQGQALVKEMVAQADFVLENFRPGTMEKWGLDYATLKAINPRLIMIRVSGFGQTGPYATQAGYGSIGEAMGGMRNLAGDPSTPPSRIGLSIGDSLAATYATLGALMALHHRERTGEGQMVDSAIYEAVLAMMESTVPEFTQAGFVRERTGSVLPNVAPSNAYPTRDGDVLIGANQDTVFRRFAAAMGRPELADDPRYASHDARGARQAELDALIADWTRTFAAQDLLDLMAEHGVPAGKIFKAPDMVDDPHYQAREALVKVDHPRFDKLWMQNVFPKLSATPGQVNWAGPELGQHNDEVYGGLLGKSAQDLAALKSAGIV
ncbi:formyl-CoA transferase [Rhodothalassium salexigens DSM 2132]|uniref:Formyl-CoA transferase n=1 Tax=Rhodothalassium salexigens DSM 2132 TaxID=1188247 RepID=A0A4R2PF05_RHOSA|nr:CaiB/BaiF CoA-transferase family protein [Rhodothalassium salexigens]MBB4211829.1 crotonobetainyl-CoA:carnitine CoA-transferase CaiB-like acyl-CoA transferase [Rhodothalassium salexigens DSM 2132]MBK1638872.1 formyl-CoA transferase [Rhodothalassium salexigens DSM 2132]TCP33873.1 formyl-CoA transferase [Rhodothalassium salexigens DSM 2132]